MLTRRTLLSASALSCAAILTKSDLFAETALFETVLPVPELIDAKSNENAFTLTAEKGTHAYRRGQPVASFGYSAAVLGPTVRVSRAEGIDVTVVNKTGVPTTVHWHGLVILGASDGGPHNLIGVDQQWRTKLQIDQPETTAWYHPHLHGQTAQQVQSGLAGIIIVEDGSGERIGLPRAYGVDDFPLVLQDRFFDQGGAPVYQPGPMDVMAGFRGDTIIVNGVIAPAVRVPAGIVRLRLLNGANARIFNLRFSDSRTFHVIASDGGYLSAPASMSSLLIAPGERYEVLVDFSNGADVLLQSGEDQNIPMMGLTRGTAATMPTPSIMKFQIDTSIQAKVKSVPSKLVEVPVIDRTKIAARRQFLLNDMMMGGMMGAGRGGGAAMTINGQSFDMARIDVESKRGTVELWEIGSHMMAHPFHVHGTQFQVLSLNGRAPPPHMQGWKDTVLVSGIAQILVPFTQLASRDHPFMFHCHILEHEDSGMMGQYICT